MAFLLHLPKIIVASCATLTRNLCTVVRTHRRRFSFLSGRMDVFFLRGPLTGLISSVFGQRFWMILYDGWLIDPGGPRMAPSVIDHLDDLSPDTVRGVVATHGHEEHAGNLELVSQRLEVPVWVAPACEDIIRSAPPLPYARRLAFGQPAPYRGPVRHLVDSLPSDANPTSLSVIAAPGHSDDQVVLYDPVQKVLLSGDAFVSQHFSSPNAEVDGALWLDTLRRLAKLPIEVLVTGHGRIYTLRDDLPTVPGVIRRCDPEVCIAREIEFLEWVQSRVFEGQARGWSPRRIEANLFDWKRPWSRQNLLSDMAARVSSGGEFSRRQLVRAFL